MLHHLEVVDIYSNSWGPDDGVGYINTGPVADSALIDGVTSVSGIFVNQLMLNYRTYLHIAYKSTKVKL